MTKRTTILAGAIIIVFVLIIALVSKPSHHTVIDSSIDSTDGAVKVFMEMMIPHHEEAVDTSLQMMEDKTASRVDVKIMAGRIYDAQTFEIIQMKGWYVDWFGTAYDPANVLLKEPYHPMMLETKGLTGEALEKAYIDGMIKHHQAAVDAAEDVLEFIEEKEKESGNSDGQLTVTSSHPGIDQTVLFAKKIIEVQSKEIDELSSLRDVK